MNRYAAIGLLILRLGVGAIFILLHGGPKILGGPEKWAGVGGMALNAIGINFYPVFWGFLAAASECFGGLALVVGLGTRVAAFFMFMTMAMATTMHLATGDSPSEASHAMLAGIVFLSLIFLGAGRYSCDALIKKK